MPHKMKGKATKGFTLIELLVVIAIIAMLASIILASLNSARAKGRDSARLADMRQIQAALELYASDNAGKYPCSGAAGACTGINWNAPSIACNATYGAINPGYDGAGYIYGLVPKYISELPRDPKGDSANRCYLYRSDGINYSFLAWSTVETYTEATNPRPRPWNTTNSTCPGSTLTYANHFALYTPGARCW